MQMLRYTAEVVGLLALSGFAVLLIATPLMAVGMGVKAVLGSLRSRQGLQAGVSAPSAAGGFSELLQASPQSSFTADATSV